MAHEPSVMLELRGVGKSYPQAGGVVEALPPFDLRVEAGEIVALVGASGCGKSTLLHIAGLLMRPDRGEVHIDGTPCHHASEREATRVRRHKLGFVYQFHHLLPELSAVANVAVPLMLQGMRPSEARERAAAMLAEIGMEDRASHLPSELSGGQQQRVAIARALIHRPALFLADEPTGNLDPQTAANVEQMMRRVLRERRASALIVTHNPEMASRMDRIVTLERSPHSS